MQSNGIEIEVLDGDNRPRNLPATITPNKEAEQEELANALVKAISSRTDELDSLKLRFLDSSLSGKEKLEEVLKFKTMLMLPCLKNSLGFYIDSELLRGGMDVMAILTGIETTIKNIITYENNENIDFSHPKIVTAQNMLFEMVMECVLEVVKEPILVREIAEKCAVRAVGIESEMNKAFKNVANKMVQTIENPLTEAFKNKNKAPDIVLGSLKDSLKRADKVLAQDLGRDELKAKIKELLEELDDDGEH